MGNLSCQHLIIMNDIHLYISLFISYSPEIIQEFSYCQFKNIFDTSLIQSCVRKYVFFIFIKVVADTFDTSSSFMSPKYIFSRVSGCKHKYSSLIMLFYFSLSGRRHLGELKFIHAAGDLAAVTIKMTFVRSQYDVDASFLIMIHNKIIIFPFKLLFSF